MPLRRLQWGLPAIPSPEVPVRRVRPLILLAVAGCCLPVPQPPEPTEPVRAGHFLVEIKNAKAVPGEGGYRVTFTLRLKNVTDKPRECPDLRDDGLFGSGITFTQPDALRPAQTVEPNGVIEFAFEGHCQRKPSPLRVSLYSHKVGGSGLVKLTAPLD